MTKFQTGELSKEAKSFLCVPYIFRSFQEFIVRDIKEFHQGCDYSSADDDYMLGVDPCGFFIERKIEIL